MANKENRSWADIVTGIKSAPEATARDKREFVWKTAKTKRSAPPISKGGCNGKHCEELSDACSEPHCKTRLEKLLSTVKSENIALNASLETRLNDLTDTRVEIFKECNTHNFQSTEMEESRLAVIRTNRKTIAPTFCECNACQLEHQQKEATLLHEKLAAVGRRLTALREFRLANDKDTLYRTSDSFRTGSKYFTPVGSSKAKGVTALRPTLQMQSSYDVAALTMNSMETRRMKTGWKDKPKPVALRILPRD